jgi:hypothetical protein
MSGRFERTTQVVAPFVGAALAYWIGILEGSQCGVTYTLTACNAPYAVGFALTLLVSAGPRIYPRRRPESGEE